MLRRRWWGACVALIGSVAAMSAGPLSAAETTSHAAIMIAELDRGLLEAHTDAYSQVLGLKLKAELQAELKQSLQPRIELVSASLRTRG